MSSPGTLTYQITALLLAVGTLTAANPASQRFYYQISGGQGQQADPYAAALLSHRLALQSLSQGQRRPGVYLIPQDNGQEGQGGGYIDSFLGLLGSYWPGSVGQPTEQKPSGEGENSVEEKPSGAAPAAVPVVMNAPAMSAVMGNPGVSMSLPASVMASPMLMAGPAIRGPEIRPHRDQVHMASLQDASEDDGVETRPADYQGFLAAARLKAAQAAIRAALAAQRGASATAEETQEHQQTPNQGQEEPLGPSIAQAKPQAVSVAGAGGVAAAAPIGTAIVGPGGMALSAPQATAVAGAPKRRPSEPESSDSRRLPARIRPDAPAPPYYFY